jgi:neutral ceramidase
VRKASSVELEKAEAILAKATKKNGQFSGWGPEVYSREAILLKDFPDKVPLIIQTLKIGDLGIAAIPCEVFAEIGLEIKKRSPLQPTFTIELANGYNGYLPTLAQHKLGGYETWRARSSYLEVNASDKIFDTVMELFATLK